MKYLNLYTAAKTAIISASVLLLTTSLFAQTDAKKDMAANASPTADTQTVNAQQASEWKVGLDAARNAVRVENSIDNPVPLALVDSPERKPRSKNGQYKNNN